MRSLSRVVLDGGYLVAYTVGVLDVIRMVRAARVPILCYHSIIPRDVPALRPSGLHTTAAAFQEQLTFLTRHYRVVPLEELVDHLRAGRRPDPRTAVITLDDGYANNALVAAPILSRFGCVATVFLATGYVGSGSLFWWDEVALILAEAKGGRTTAGAWGDVRLDSEAGRVRFHRRADELLGAATIPDRRILLDALRSAFGVRAEAPTEFGIGSLGWEDWEAAPTSLAFGGHTASHRLLDRIPKAEAEEEIRRCALDLARLGRRALPHFCYPAGRWTEHVRAALPRLGFEASVDAQSSPARERLAGMGDDLFLLPRIGVAGGISLPRFAAHVSGARAWGTR